MQLILKEISWEWRKRYVSIQTSYGKNFQYLFPSSDFSFYVVLCRWFVATFSCLFPGFDSNLVHMAFMHWDRFSSE